MNIYEKNGYENRADYLQSVADNYSINIDSVYDLASVLGSGEDFDGLICAIEDYRTMSPIINFDF